MKNHIELICKNYTYYCIIVIINIEYMILLNVILLFYIYRVIENTKINKYIQNSTPNSDIY